MTITNNWQLSPKEIFAMGPIVPVLVIKDVEDALPIAKALLAAGIKVLEVTLRTPAALDVIKIIAQELPEACVGAGTVTNREMLQRCQEAGAKFAISPGLTKDLLKAGNEGNIALIPGISSISEMMDGIDFGYDHLKFFPAEASGGVKAIQSMGGPFPDIRFCPTGGINLSNVKDYLALSNVACCGGSWLVTDEIIKNKDWAKITELAKQALAHVK
ncbi:MULTISPECIES: bifunctional 4-hydroxy-2-oxoglutarate aldolase/2-dehydro-3-deoxy-phosphogluconate aldolase [unclassified Colwellia]|jgi:2-dehydro-3-deoxyphosphogluconate aldolase/(4S)-4-hydroxy-2-oxoglutarate aldolase|uniref:bifunctional 4-hydroxy-2-oxoglutarate aldolase/2-dehydro-3-deoxy-phosphogluconate aldolase n=1 Tax=unclassified Colwellia TaxID=196834 RepID=UPI000A5DF126|nr:bifunctional 4-hydroxy-2-oxoglutarate aldolase/2-dehydro-3-deoxy-phosphogluconate aldolase [Colwellia sp. BRX8-7]MBA6346750.1 bifunctional 4-hydroxy-2-oxoglutarate aldolase/2-dehydro-3-deoxy-phosphogluconate aldolase [Colwellia sp. BRX8-9]MBA6353446.1 bifunctional 4-hydroxy-2-oxoglutarate aldolase/2-dehydro-3-deoxy-phosphogluconate aldolase [Colwellia sp. BRX9-1]MBA6357412.1 bifunctional 4-hydroxy-2-oxoglutarate aldolase/2-dehydro-3-deoxy-phosphogluconate aldolase [Colwellia sp. BRX8-3]MBA63|tara:strand:+ start:1200 stop:1847 length:648 start_codon:yes stop_codon:yes gene_type:complete